MDVKDDAPQADEARECDEQSPHHETIETWFRDHFSGSALLADTTERYNAAYAAKEDLKKRLER